MMIIVIVLMQVTNQVPQLVQMAHFTVQIKDIFPPLCRHHVLMMEFAVPITFKYNIIQNIISVILILRIVILKNYIMVIVISKLYYVHGNNFFLAV